MNIASVLTCFINGIDNKTIIANPGMNRKENGYIIVTLVATEKIDTHGIYEHTEETSICAFTINISKYLLAFRQIHSSISG